MAFIQVKEGKSPDEILEKINQHFPELSATHSGNLIGQIRFIKVVETSARTISIISFIACCIIVMNTFMMAVTERTKEIGILRAVGWSRWMVARNIVFEAMGICLLGGILGNLVGLVQLWIFSQVNPEGLGWWVSSVRLRRYSVEIDWVILTAGNHRLSLSSTAGVQTIASRSITIRVISRGTSEPICEKMEIM